MIAKHVLVETNFLTGAFGMPHRRNPKAVNLWSRFQDGQIKLHIPFLWNTVLGHIRGALDSQVARNAEWEYGTVRTLSRLSEQALFVRVLGSYPEAE